MTGISVRCVVARSRGGPRPTVPGSFGMPPGRELIILWVPQAARPPNKNFNCHSQKFFVLRLPAYLYLKGSTDMRFFLAAGLLAASTLSAQSLDLGRSPNTVWLTTDCSNGCPSVQSFTPIPPGLLNIKQPSRVLYKIEDSEKEIFHLGKGGCLRGPLTVYGYDDRGNRSELFTLAAGIWFPADCNK